VGSIASGWGAGWRFRRPARAVSTAVTRFVESVREARYSDEHMFDVGGPNKE
jgi:hypothetical protein